MQRAVNPQTGEVLFLVDNQWVKPTQRAFNPETGQDAYLVNNEWQTMPMPSKEGAKPTDRTMGEAIVTDPLAALLSGAGTAMGSPGQLKQLLTGEKPAEEKPKGTIESLAQSLLPFGVDISKIPEKVLEKLTPSAPSVEGVTSAALSPFQGIQPVGEELKAFGEKQKSAGLKAAEKGREKAIQEAEGFLPEVGAAVGQTIKNPALLSSFIFEQIPNFAGTLGGGFLSKEAAKAFFKDATEKTLGKIGVGGAVATGGAMQAGDIGSETYQTIYDRLVKEGTPQDEAHQIALEKGRMAAAQAGAISVASSLIPGGKALERRFLTEAGKKAGFPGFIPGVGNIIGEATQEGVEEGGGKLVSNIQAAQVFPDIDVMKGVGAATGLGALGGGVFGGISNVPSALSRTAPTEPAPSGAPPTAGTPVTPPAAPAVPLEAQLEETPANVRLLELEKALKEVDLAFQNPDLTADDFRNLNNLAGQIRSQIAQIQSGEEGVTPVTPTPEAAQPTQAPVEAAPVEVPAPAPIETPAVPEAAKPVEVPAVEPVVAPQSEQAYRMKYAVEAIDKGETKLTARNVNPLAKELGIKPGVTPEETLANVKQALGIEAAPESVAPKATEVVQEPVQVEAPIAAEVKPAAPTKEEKVAANKARQAEKKAKVEKPKQNAALQQLKDRLQSENLINVVSTKDGKNFYATGSNQRDPDSLVKLDLTPEEFRTATNLEKRIKEASGFTNVSNASEALRKYLTPAAERAAGVKAKSEQGKEALLNIKPIIPAKEEKLIPTKEDKAAANKARQEEKKAAAAKAKEPVDMSAVKDLIEGKVKKFQGYTIYKRKEDPDFWYVQSRENKAANKIGPGDEVSTNLDTARSKVEDYVYRDEAEGKPKAEAKPVEKKAAKEFKPAEEKGTLRISSPTEADIAKNLSKYLGGSTIRIEGENVYNAKGLIPHYKVRKEGKRYKLYETAETKPAEVKKPSTALVPKVDEEWAEFKQELKTKPSSMDQSIWNKYQDFQKGDFAFNKVSFTGANALARSNAANKAAKETYDKAAREFLNHEISAKAPTKNAPKLDVLDAKLVAVPAPIAKNIKPVKTLEDQKKAMLTIAADKKEHRQMLQGILVEPDKMIVTDGHRLAMYKTDTGVAEKTLLDKDGKVIDMQYPPYDRILDRARNATSYGMVNATALGNYARGTRKAWKYVSANVDSPISIQLKDGKQVVPFNGRYIEDMANMFRQFGYDGFDIQYNDGGMLIGVSPDGKLTQVVMGMKDVNWIFMPFSVKTNTPGVTKLEPDVIDIQATEITEDQVKLLTNETKKLSKEEMATLEAHYGFSRETKDFLKMLREDIINYVNKGADAVDAAIRDIIKKLQAGVLAVAMVFNPAYMSQQSAVVYPSTVTTEQVKAVVPESAKDMSESGKKAFAAIFPAIKPRMAAENKLFTVVDKPTSKVYVFQPDGSLLLKDNVVLGMALGDTYVGDTDFKGNRITPAGLMKVKAERGSATYDGKTIYTVGNVKEGWNTAFMHTVYLKESDAEARKQALATGEKTRLSHGCVNASPEVMAKIGEGNRMDGSHVFVVPDNQSMTDAYISNNVSNEDLTRETVTPVTEQVPAKQAAAVKPAEVIGREEKALEPKTKAQINRERQMAKLAKEEPTGTFYNNFEPDFTEEDFDHSVDDVRKEKIKEQAVNSRRITAAVKKIADMGSDLKTQYELNRAINAKKALADEIDAMKQPKTLPEDIMARAAKERAEFQRTGGLDGLSPEAYAVLEALYQKNPNILNGLKLSVRRTERRGVTGSFEPIQRIVTVYKKGISAIFGGAGEKQAKTMRHEITHSLEQMMDSEARKVLVNAWANSLQKAIKKYEGDEVYQDYFNAVLDFIEKPSEATYRKATDLMPEYKMYQYISPSEFWAVNAEPLLDAQLGGAWARFTKAVKGLWEAIKSVFGFDNRYAIHREFNRIMAGDQQRITKSMLVDYLDQTGVSKKFINNIEEERNLIEDLNLPEVPEHEERSMKDMAVAGYRKMQDWGKEFGDNPGKTATKSLIAASDKVTQFRIDNIFFGAGVEKRDQQRYNGQIRAADGLMAASIAIKNAIHSAHIATRVITQGGLELSKQFGQFVAVKSENSMGNVVRLQYKLKKKLGTKTALQIINAYFIAKRSRSIQNEFLNASANLEKAMDSGDFAQIAEAQSDYNSIKTAYGKIPRYFRQLNEDGKPEYETIYDDNGKAVDRIPILNDDAIDRAIGMEKLHPELKEMMKNWTAVNQNMLDMLALSGRLSKKAADKLKAIKDYVPWYRIMDDQEDIHDGKLMSNYPGGPKRFKAGETDRDIDNVVESMIHNVVMMTRSATKNYAINRVIAEYGQRYEEGPKKGKLMVFPSEGKDAQGTRIASFIGGRRVVTNIPDDLVADGVLGLIAAPFTFPLQNVLSAAANGFRRAITFTPWFQLKQAFIDAPTAAWVSGVRSPFKLWGACFEGFVRALKVSDEDPIVQILRNAGIGGYQSFHRSARKEREIELGLLERSNYATFLSAIDHVGDASDLSQRVAVYKRVLAESGDPGLALLQASDIIDFQKHGKGRLAQAMRTTVTFMQAYATQIDALAQASIGGNLKGKTRAEARKQFRNTGLMLATTTLLYVMMAGADDDYWELDDQTRLRNLYIPGSKKATGHHILIPMSTSASFFFKVIPEQLYAKVVTEGTKNEMDARRVWKALGTAAIDSLLGPNPVPTGAKPVIEIALNRNFYTGGDVVPKGLEGLEAAQQYNASTSELGHAVSKLTGGVLNPIQADHLMRGIGGSVATLSMYFSNLAFGENRPEPDLRQNPVIGNLVAPEISRKNEELFYDLREAASEKYRTYQSLLADEKFEEADKYFDKNEKLIVAYDYVSKTDADLKQINKEIRRLGKSVDKDLTPQIRTQEINELKRTKVDILEDITEFRKEAGF